MDLSTLVERLSNTWLPERLCAAREIAKLGAPAVPALITALEHGNEELQYGALLAICLLGPGVAVEAAPAVMRALGSPDLHVCSEACLAAQTIGPVPSLIEGLIGLLHAPSASERDKAIYVLERIGEGATAAVPALLANTAHPALHIRVRACRALRLIDPTGAVTLSVIWGLKTAPLAAGTVPEERPAEVAP